MSWNLFDAHAVVGRHLKLTSGGPHTTADLLAEMDHYGIAEALVLDCLSRELHIAPGNERVLTQTAGQPRLHPAWALLPPGADDEQPPPAQLLERLRAERVAAAWLLPGQYRYRLSDWCLDPLLEPLAEAGVPLFVDFTEVGPGGWPTDACDWEQIVDLGRRFPTLPIIVSEFRIRRGQRLAYRALDACPNLRLELSGYWLDRGIEYITKRWGPERLLFGTRWPTFGPHMTLATLTLADISDEAKRLIAGDNLRGLLGWCGVEHPAYTAPPPGDEYVAYVRAGSSERQPARLPELVWDCHGHLGGHFSHYHLPGGALEATVAEMDRQSIERICVFSFSGVGSDETYGNDLVAEAVARYPERFTGFTLVNPHRGPEAMWAELERGHAMGLRGVKLIPTYQGYPEEGPHIDVACRWAHEHRQLILNHYWGSPAQMERLVSTYPGAVFLTGHTTVAYAEIMRRHPNLYVCSCPLLGPRACEEVVAAIGAERFMFGSDLQDLPIAWGLGPILCARVSPAEKQLILGGNLRRLLAETPGMAAGRADCLA